MVVKKTAQTLISMLITPREAVPWDLNDKRTLRLPDVGQSFLLVIDAPDAPTVNKACLSIKQALQGLVGGIKGPLAAPTERRRYMAFPMPDGTTKLIHRVKRHRRIILITKPTYSAGTALINLALPTLSLVRIEQNDGQYNIHE